MNSRYPFAVIKEKLNARRGEVADFAIGSRKVGLSQEIQDWIQKSPDLITRPASHQEVSAFNRAAVEMVSDVYGVAIDDDCIVPVPGGRVGMSAFIASMVQPGDDVVATVPGYPAFARMAAHRHANIYNVSLDPDARFAPDFAALPATVSAKIIALNYPNNPTGATLNSKTLESLTEFAASNGAALFNDAVYGPLTYGERPETLLGDSDAHDSPVIELHSLTKLYPLGPLSGSFLAGSRDLMQAISTYSEFAWAPMSSLQVQATTRCMQDSEGRDEKRSFYASQLQKLRDVLIAAGFEPYPTPAGIYVLCRIPNRIGGQGVSGAEQAAAILMDDFDIAVVPFESGEDHYLRFASMYRDEDLQKLQSVTDRLRVSD